MKKIYGVFLVLMYFTFFIGGDVAFSETVFTYLDKAANKDTRQDYHIELLKIALDKTVKKYGPYRLVPAPKMNAARSVATIRAGVLENYFANETVTTQKLDELGYVPFPILRGIVGYRVFFVSPKKKYEIRNVRTLMDLRKFTIGQGIGWEDNDIIKYNNINVVISNYESLFKMVAANRFDLFARGIVEVLGEYEAFQGSVDLTIDDSIALYCPNPRFFFTHKSIKDAIERVSEGLFAAYEDGSFMKLWNEYHLDSINYVDLNNRIILELENPFIEGIDKSYEKYMFKP